MKRIGSFLLAGVAVLSVPSMALADGEEDGGCEYSLTFDQSKLDFGNVIMTTKRYINLQNNSVGESCAPLSVKQLKTTHGGQGVFTNSAFSGSLAPGDSVEVEVTMTPNYTDTITKYQNSDLFVQAIAKDENGRHVVKTWADLKAIEAPEDSACSYSIDFDKSLYDFGTVTSISTIQTLQAYLTNTGNCAVIVKQEKLVDWGNMEHWDEGSGLHYGFYTLYHSDHTPLNNSRILNPGEKISYDIALEPYYGLGKISNTDIFVQAFQYDKQNQLIKPEVPVKTHSNLSAYIVSEIDKFD